MGKPTWGPLKLNLFHPKSEMRKVETNLQIDYANFVAQTEKNKLNTPTGLEYNLKTICYKHKIPPFNVRMTKYHAQFKALSKFWA